MKITYTLIVIGLFLNSCIVLKSTQKETLDLSHLERNKGKTCLIKTNKPYSGKVSGWDNYWRNSKIYFAGIENFACRIGECNEWGCPMPDSRAFITGKLKKGVVVGEWYFYSKDSVLRVKANYVNGKLDGNTILYDENGKIWCIDMYKTGENIKYTVYLLDTLMEKNFLPDSVVNLSKLKKDNNGLFYYIGDSIPYSGKISGNLWAWDSNLQIANIDYFGEKIYSKSAENCFPRNNREIVVKGTLINGKEVDEWLYYFDGWLKVKANFKNGLLDGETKFYEFFEVNRIEKHKYGKLFECTEIKDLKLYKNLEKLK